MVIDTAQQEILKDIDRLSIAYQIKLHHREESAWQPYFHRLSLDSHRDNQLFLAQNRLWAENKQSLLLSGIALSKQNQIKEINLVGNRCCFVAIIGCPSPVLEKKLPEVENSANARWKCIINLTPGEEKQNLELIIILDNGQKITYQTIEFRLVNLTRQQEYINQQISKNLASKLESIYQSRQLMADTILQHKNYLFAIGNARSGTTALGKLLNSSDEICLGIERYSTNDNVSAASFTRKLFFDPQSKNYLVRPQLYDAIKGKFDQAKYIGDKRPRFVKCWRNTWLNLPKAKIVYIFRHIYGVAHSYNTRASNAAQGIDQSWSSTRDFSQAVREWNEGLQEIRQLKDFYSVYLVKYEDFFVDQSKMIHLFDYLQVNAADSKVCKTMSQLSQTALALQNKPRILTESEREYIDAQADFESYNYLLALYEQQFV